jgi:hypothetical protein
MLTRLSSVELALVIIVILFGATGLGIWAGRVMSRRQSGLKEPLGIFEQCLLIVLKEEWEHRLYAARDLAVLGASA